MFRLREARERGQRRGGRRGEREALGDGVGEGGDEGTGEYGDDDAQTSTCKNKYAHFSTLAPMHAQMNSETLRIKAPRGYWQVDASCFW